MDDPHSSSFVRDSRRCTKNTHELHRRIVVKDFRDNALLVRGASCKGRGVVTKHEMCSARGSLLLVCPLPSCAGRTSEARPTRDVDSNKSDF